MSQVSNPRSASKKTQEEQKAQLLCWAFFVFYMEYCIYILLSEKLFRLYIGHNSSPPIGIRDAYQKKT
ncbi:MAG TPA: hypothetical protein DCX41_02195 [Aequorivita sp.]|nr:hypothetical protein [Aequorivita sp.]